MASFVGYHTAQQTGQAVANRPPPALGQPLRSRPIKTPPVKTRLRRRAAPDKEGKNDDNPLLALLSGGVAFFSGLIGSFFSLLDSFKEGAQHQQSTSSSTARIVQQLGAQPVDTQSGAPVYSLGPFPKCTDASNLRLPDRHFTIISTAALPWRTGPAVNALLRALNLAASGRSVRLVLPWIQKEEQELLFDGWEVFDDKAGQEDYIRRWCKKHAKMDVARLPLQFEWYDAQYLEEVRSVFPSGDCSAVLGEGPFDVLILEEPEHLCWYHNGARWPELFKHVIGVVHTNYRAYISELGYEGLLSTPAVRDSIFLTFTSMVCSAYCDVTIKPSGAGVSLPNEITCNVHGVRDEFFQIGKKVDGGKKGGQSESPGKAYLLGKAVFQKGWGELLDYLKVCDGLQDLRIEGFGSGPDAEKIKKKAEEVRSAGKADLQISHGIDHSDPRLQEFTVLVNPSTSEMLCTVTAEALAMRKRAVLPQHPSNDFFAKHFKDRCHFFEVGKAGSFETAVQDAMAAGRAPALTAEMEEVLSWKSALQRLYDSAEVHVLSGTFQRPSAVAGSRLAYDLHRRIQTDTPAISNLLKSATLKAKAHTPWEEYVAEWQETESGKFIMKQVELLN